MTCEHLICKQEDDKSTEDAGNSGEGNNEVSDGGDMPATTDVDGETTDGYGEVTDGYGEVTDGNGGATDGNADTADDESETPQDPEETHYWELMRRSGLKARSL